MPDKIDQLYEALRKDGAVTKSRDNFRNYVLAPGDEGVQNRKALFEALKADGAVTSPTQDEFERRLEISSATSSPSTQTAPGTTTAPNAVKQQDAAAAGGNSGTLGKLGGTGNIGKLQGAALGGAIGAVAGGGNNAFGGGTSGGGGAEYQWSYTPPQPDAGQVIQVQPQQPTTEQQDNTTPTTQPTTTTIQNTDDEEAKAFSEFVNAANKGGRDLARGVDENGNKYTKEIKGVYTNYYYDEGSVAQYLTYSDGVTRLKRFKYANGDVDVYDENGNATRIEAPHVPKIGDPGGVVYLHHKNPYLDDDKELSKLFTKYKNNEQFGDFSKEYKDKYSKLSESQLLAELDNIKALKSRAASEEEKAKLAYRQNHAILELNARRSGFSSYKEAKSNPGMFAFRRLGTWLAENYPSKYSDAMLDENIYYQGPADNPRVVFEDRAKQAVLELGQDTVDGTIKQGAYYTNYLLGDKEKLADFLNLCMMKARWTNQDPDKIIQQEYDKMASEVGAASERLVDAAVDKMIEQTPKWKLATYNMLGNTVFGQLGIWMGKKVGTWTDQSERAFDLASAKYYKDLGGWGKFGIGVGHLVGSLPEYLIASSGVGGAFEGTALAATTGGRILMSTLTMEGVGLMNMGAHDLNAGEFSGWGQWGSTAVSSAATGAVFGVAGEGARMVSLRPTSQAAVLFNKGVEYSFETAAFTVPEWVSTIYNGVTPEGDPVSGEYFVSSALNNLGVVIAMKGRRNFKNWKPVVKTSDLAQLKVAYPELYDNLTHNLDMATRGKPVDELSEAAKTQLTQLQDDMMTPGKGVSWNTYKKTMNLFGFEVIPPAPSAVRNEGNVVQVLDSYGNVISEKKFTNSNLAKKESKKLNSQIEHGQERRNAEIYTQSRMEKLYYDACADMADRMSENKEWRKRGDDGNFLVDENGNYIADENYQCVTPEDVDAALKQAYSTPEAERNAEQAQLISFFESNAKQLSNSIPDVKQLAEIVCSTYGITVEQLENVSRLAPSERRDNKATQAIQLFNEMLTRGVATSSRPVGRVKLKHAETGDAFIEVYNEANPANKDGYYFYKDATGQTRWLPANEVDSFEPIVDEQAQRYKVSNDNTQSKIKSAYDGYVATASMYNDEALAQRINWLLDKYDLKVDDDGNILRKKDAKRGDYTIDENGMASDEADLLKLRAFMKVQADRAAAKQGEDNMRNLRSERERAEAVRDWGEQNGATYDVDYLVEHPLELDELVKKMESGQAIKPDATAEAPKTNETIDVTETTGEPVVDDGTTTEDMLPSIEETVDWMFPNASAADRAAYIEQYTKNPKEIEKSRINLAILRSHQQPQGEPKTDDLNADGAAQHTTTPTTDDTTKTAPTSIEAGGRYNVVDEQGAQHEVEVLRDNGNGTVEVRVDGAEDSMPMAKDQLAAMLGIDVALTKPQTEQPTAKPQQEPVEQPAPVATNEMKDADVDAGETGLSLREKAGAYVDAYFPDVKGDEREGFIEQLVAQNDFENTIRFDKEDGVNLDRVAKYEQRIAELEKERAATNSKEASDDSGEAVEPYRIDEAADPDAIAEAGFSEDNLAATVDYLNGKIDKRKYLERLGFDKDVLAGIDDDKVNTWVEGVANRASEFLTDKPVESDEVPADAGTTLTPTPQPEAADATKEVEATPEPMPMREVGKGKNKTTEPDWQAVSPERGREWLFNESGLDNADANEIVNNNLEAAQKAVDKASKLKPKKTTNPFALQAERERIANEQAAAQSALDYWKKVKAIEQDRQAQAAAERKAKDAEVAAQAQAEEAQRQAEELAKQQEQAQRGAGAVHPAIAEKWNNAPKIEGYKDEITLANGERVPGTYYLVESGAVTPSHNASREFEKYEGFPVDENGNTINDRDYERDKDAQNITRSIADKYDSRALQTPVIVSKDGVVLSGNGRTMAGELAASNNTDGAYIEHLKNYGRKYGFSPEQVSSMQHPRAVFVPDADMPYTTDTFAKFNAQEMKGQSKTEQAVKLGKVVDDATFNQIVRSINEYETLPKFYANKEDATVAINALRRAGALNEMQYAEMFDGDAVSDRGRQMIENMLIGKAFENNPDAIRQLTEFKGLRQSVVTALGEISTNLALGKDYSLEKELSQAIDLTYHARHDGYKDGEPVSPYATTMNLFPFDFGETEGDYNNATVLLLADKLNHTNTTALKKWMHDYNHRSAQSAAGQLDLLSGGIESKQEILKSVLDILNNGETEETSRPEQRGSVADERGGEASLQENGAGDNGEQDSAALITPQAKPAVAVQEQISLAEQQTETSPTDAQKEAGNYKKGHVKIDGFEISIEQPKGSVRSGVDDSGKPWSQTMNNTYGYIRGTEGVDGDHIDVFLSDNLDGWNGTVYVVDQVNKDGSFDEHKVMYGFNSEEEARKAYLSNYEKGWQGLGAITPVSKDEFKKWIDSSHRKTKPFAEYKNVKVEETQEQEPKQQGTLFPATEQQPSSKSETKPRTTEKQPAEAPKERIDDVGEKIEGAKKDLAKKMGERINLDADTFPKMFPKYDLKKLISQGLDPNLAVMTKMLRQMAQADYKHYSKKRMYGKSYALRAARFYAAYAKQVLEAGDSNVDFKSEGLGFTDYGKQFVELNKRLFEEFYNKLGDDLFDLDLAGVKIQPLSQKEGSTWFRRNQETGEMEPYNPAYAFVGPRGQNYYEANELDKALQEGVEQVTKSIDYKKSHPYKLGHYYKPGIKNSDYVGVKLGGKIVPLTEPMTSSEVRKYMSEHNAELQAKAAQLDEQRKLDKKKGGTGEGRWKPELTLGGGRPRVGVDRRGGVDVEPEEFRKAFSFRGVQFGNYVTQRERQRFLNEAYDALMDMAELLGISPRAIAIDGRLGFAIGARGGGKANAHYEPKENVINLTKSKGAGSLAHEWFHALDYYFNRGDKKPTASTANKSTEQFPASTRNEMRKAFLDLMSAIKNSDYFKRSENLEMKLRSGKLDEGYYDKPTELAARAFQDYVVRKLADKGKINDFLSSFTSEEEWNGEPENYPFPIGAEAEKIDEKFDALFDAMQERTDEEGNIILYHLGKDHDVLTDTEIALRDGLVEILRSVGLADEPDEIKGQKELDSAIQANATLQEMRGWHGSAAEFDEFDHSHMSEGEGNQAIGYGTYIASIEEIGRYYGTVAAMQKRFRAAPGYGDYDHYWKGQKIDLSSINPLRMAYDIVQREGTIKKAITMVEKFVDNPEAHEGWRSALDILRESRKSDFKRKRANYEGERYLYEVDIPENDGTNYLPWDEPLSDAMRERIAQGLRDMGVDLNEPFERRTGKADNFDFLDEQMSEHPITGQELYYKLVDRFGRYPQQASEFLNKYCGLVGIEYPSNFFSGGNKKGLKNHVIFNEKDIKIDNRTQYFISADGVVYGFVKDGKIYIDPKIATAETPIHEYCHLWGDALKEANPEAWERLKETMLGEKDVLDYVKKMYPGLEGDALVSEVFSHYSGRRGAERLRADMEREMKNAEGVFAKARVARIFDIIKRALSRFWTMARDLFAGKTRGLDRLTAEDFADMAMSDLLRGFNPRKKVSGETFYSNAERAVENIKQNKATAEQWLAMIKKDGGLKAGEDRWLGLSDWLAENKGNSLTKDEVLNFIRENGIEMVETTYGEVPQSFDSLKREYDQWLHDEGFDYAQEQLRDRFGDDADIAFDDLGGELVVANEEAAAAVLGSENIINSTRLDYTTEGLDNKREIAFVTPEVEPYRESDEVHFGPENEGKAVMWVRYGETTDVDGNRVLVIDEIQSNRHQDARERGYVSKGETLNLRNATNVAQENYDAFTQQMKDKYNGDYADIYANDMTDAEREHADKLEQEVYTTSDAYEQTANRIPAAPFEKNWHEVAMKRMLRLAAEEGFDKVAWTTGKQQAERYSLEGKVDRLVAYEDKNGELDARAIFPDGTYTTIGKTWDEVGRYVGKSVAQQLRNSADTENVHWGYDANMRPLNYDYKLLKADNITVGGEGMKGFYDNILPRFMDKYGKKWGVKTGTVELPNVEEAGRTMHSVDVTPAMRASVMSGQPMFQKAAPNDNFEDVPGVNKEHDEYVSIKEVEDYLATLPNAYNVHGVVEAHPINSLESLEALKPILDLELYDEIKKRIYHPNVYGCRDSKTGMVFVFTHKIWTLNHAEHNWWHENSHGAYDALELADKEDCGREALDWLLRHGHMSQNAYDHYKDNERGSEGAARLIAYIFDNYGVDGILNKNFDGNEKIAKLATAIQNYYKYGETRENKGVNLLRQGQSQAEPRTREDAINAPGRDRQGAIRPEGGSRAEEEIGSTQRGTSIIDEVNERGSSYRNSNGDVIPFESHAEQLSLFNGGDVAMTSQRTERATERAKRVKEMSDAELLKEMQRDIAEFEKLGRGDWGIQTACTDEYDRRHIKEYNAECERVRTMLDENNVSIEEAEDMLCNAIYSWRDGYATADRSKLLAQFDTLNDYYAEKTDERDNADLYQEVESEQAISEADARNTETPTQQEVAPTTQQTEPAKPTKTGFDPSAIKLRKLKSGETCHVERRYQESGGFDFTGSEIIKDDADLAYIFRNLENSAIENTFLVLIKNGKATILHTGMGSYAASVGHVGAGLLAASKLKPDHVIFVHNHPSGRLEPSVQDVAMQTRAKKMFGEGVVREAIIIDITSGEYCTFDDGPYTNTEVKKRPTEVENEIPYKTYSFSQYVFDKNYKPGTTMQITDANKAAAFISSHRLGERDKMSLIVMSRSKYVTANVFLPWTTLDGVDIEKAATTIAKYIHQMGGESGIVYGSATIDRNILDPLSREIERREVHLDDFITVEGRSAQQEGVLEDEVLYEAVPRNIEQQPTEVAEDSVGYGEADDSGISDEELAGYDAGRYSFAESITQGLVDLALKNTHDQQLRLNAMREFGGNLAKLRKIMNKQKAYDKGTVDDIVRLARMVMGSGFFKDMSAYEVKRLLAAIKKGVGAEDLTPIANNVVDMLVQHQLRESKAMLHKLMQVRGRKVDARGVEVQAGLDIDGQRMMSALKDGMSLSEDGLSTRINDCENRLGSDDEVIRKNAMSEYQGLMLAKEYHDNILSGEEEEIVLRQEKRQEQEKIYDFRREPVLDDDGNAIINQDGSVRTVERKTLKPEFKGAMTDENKRLRRNTEAAIERIEQSIRENRMERVTAYSDFMSDVAGDVRASRERAAAWRAEQQERIDAIHHNANSDLEGVPVQSQTKMPEGGLLAFNSNNDIVRLLFQPLATFEKMLRFFGRKAHNGEGYLFNRFMRGWADCSDKEWRSKRAAHEDLDSKVRELFGKKAKRWSDLYEIERNKKHPGIPVEYWDNGERVRETMSQGEALSLVVWSKQKDAEAGLRRMGISEEDIETIKNNLDPKFLQLAEWVVEEFLPKRREYYNEVHERMFGAPMAAIEHYFPIVRNSRDVEKPSDITERDLGDTKPSTITGNIIKRQRTAATLDVHTDFFDHLLKHLDDMENWAAWAEFNRDINTLRNYKRFKNRVLNMHSVEYGSGKDLWKAFDDACAIVAGVYHPSTKRGSGDNLAVNIAKGVTGAKIAFRFYTAAKQLLSLPAFWNGDASLLELAKWENPVGAIIAWNWAMKNLPGFSKRWQSRQVGDVRLMDTDSDYAFWRNNMVRALSRGGMWANALVDGMTVAMGARAVYETKKKRYLRNGYSEEQAEKRAMQDAAINYNSSQQSSENAFLSSLQLDRTWWSTLMTVFRSASMGYQRRLTTGLRNLKNRMKKGYKAESIEFMKKQMERDGVDEATAEKAAKRTYRWGGLRSMADVFVFGYVLPFFWFLGPYALYLLMGDDDDEKKDMLKDAAVHSLFGPVEGLTGGQAMSEIGNTWAGYAMSDNDKSLLNALRYHDYLSMPLGSDLQQIFNEAGNDSMAAWTDAFNLLVQAGIGINPETFTDAWVAIADACDGDPQTTKEFALCFMRVMQVPQTQTDKLFIDELGMTAKDAQKLNAMEMADRYARYKKFRNAPLLNWAYSPDESKKVAEKYRKRFLDNMQERMEHMDDEQLGWNFENPNDSERRKAVGKVYAKGKGVQDSAGKKPASNWKPETRRSQLKYQRLRDYNDLAEDVLLDVAIDQAKNRGDHETEKALRDAKKELTEIKRGKHTKTIDINGLGDGSADDDKAIMEELRARRKEILQEYGVI